MKLSCPMAPDIILIPPLALAAKELSVAIALN